MPVLSKNGEARVRTIIRLPIPIIPCTPIDADNPGPVSIVVPVVVISVVMSSVTISVVPSTVIISRSRRRNKTGDTEHHSKHWRKKIFHNFSPETIKRGDCFVVAKYLLPLCCDAITDVAVGDLGSWLLAHFVRRYRYLLSCMSTPAPVALTATPLCVERSTTVTPA